MQIWVYRVRDGKITPGGAKERPLRLGQVPQLPSTTGVAESWGWVGGKEMSGMKVEVDPHGMCTMPP